jgi:aryl-alcohol dehydrogenase-like predicted oxidoreductase
MTNSTNWQFRPFGNTDLTVSVLGLGAGQIGDANVPETEVGHLLNSALDMGITLIDTARGYGLSEERIGRHLKQRRHEFVLSTKIGYDIAGYQDWTGPIITAGIEAALQRLQTDYLDIVHLHSCDLGVLRQGEVVEALLAAVKAGKIRVAAYSGENEALEWAVDPTNGDSKPVFGSIETSINICDQRNLANQIITAHKYSLGVIAKRPVANIAWRFAERPVGQYAEVYWERLQAMQIDPQPYTWQELALRFTAYLPGVHSCIVGTHSLDHLRQNLELVERGPLPETKVKEIRQLFHAHDQNWIGQV